MSHESGNRDHDQIYDAEVREFIFTGQFPSKKQVYDEAITTLMIVAGLAENTLEPGKLRPPMVDGAVQLNLAMLPDPAPELSTAPTPTKKVPLDLPSSKALLESLYELTGARIIADHREFGPINDARKQAEVTREGLFQGVPVYFVESFSMSSEYEGWEPQVGAKVLTKDAAQPHVLKLMRHQKFLLSEETGFESRPRFLQWLEESGITTENYADYMAFAPRIRDAVPDGSAIFNEFDTLSSYLPRGVNENVRGSQSPYAAETLASRKPRYDNVYIGHLLLNKYPENTN